MSRSPFPALVLSGVLLAWAIGLGAQSPPTTAPVGEWNGPEALELAERARLARRALATGGGLETYTALTEGHIYFFVDPEVGERVLIRVDQVAVELSWRAPDEVRQHIVGERSETLLPVQDFRYYLDRLTLVQYGLGDEIRVGAGLDVAGVPHPFADRSYGGGSPYDFRVADSLSISLPGLPEPVRLYELEVRPKDAGAPGVLGSITVDRSSANIVRMSLTFTPSSYVDSRNDRISVELDYGLWEGRYWLPNLQRIEVRREIPGVDLGVGTVIRAVLRTRDYRLNEPVPLAVSARPPVTRALPSVRAEYSFPEGLYDGVQRDGLARAVRDADPAELRAQAVELLEERYASGLSPLRLHVPRASSLLRYSRTEGVVPGAGFTLRPLERLTTRAHAGYGFGDRRLRGSVLVRASLPGVALEASGTLREARDLGLAPASDPLLSTLGTLFLAEDYRDPWFASGGAITVTGNPDPSSRLVARLGIERVESASLAVDRAPFASSREARPARGIEEGTFTFVGARALWAPSSLLPARSTFELGVQALDGDPGGGVGLTFAGDLLLEPPSRGYDVRLRVSHWSWTGDPLALGHRLLGGRGSLPGYAFRSFVGREVAAASLETSANVWRRLVRARAGLHAGWARGPDPTVAAAWGARGSDGVRWAASVGAGFVWDILRLDLARGLGGGEWQLTLSIDPAWWEYL